MLLAEGIFAIEALPLARAAGLNATGIYIDRPGFLVAWYRFVRDLSQKRKAPWVLVRRGLALWRAQGALKRRALANGFASLSYAGAEARLSELARQAVPAQLTGGSNRRALGQVAPGRARSAPVPPAPRPAAEAPAAAGSVRTGWIRSSRRCRPRTRRGRPVP